MKFIHVGDVHLNGNFESSRGWNEERKEDVYLSLQSVVALANREQVDYLFFTGDIFDAPPTMEQLKKLDEILMGLKQTWVFMIAGNHDYITENSAYLNYEFLSKVYMFKEDKVKCVHSKSTDTYIYGYSYHQPQITKAVFDDIKPYKKGGRHILLAHGGDATHIPMNQEELKWSGFDYIALGHIHEPRVLADDLMCYGGSLEPLDRTETGRHGVFLGEFTKEHHFVKFVPISQRNYIDIYVTFEPDMNRIAMYQQIHEEILNYGIDQMFTLYLQGTKKKLEKLDYDILYEKYHIVNIMEDVIDEEYEIVQKRENQPNIVSLVEDKLKDQQDALKYALEGLQHD
ncbi:MAG: metallophosphoesterase family protein [Anaerostipes sp.]|jgi:exonuclease SbcD